MKQSRFNVVVDGNDGEQIVYNTLSGALAVFDNRSFSDFRDCSGNRMRELLANGFLVEDGIDETAAPRKAFMAVCKNPDKLILSIVPTYQCNFACVYCYEPDGTKPGHMGEDVADAIMRFVGDLYRRDRFTRFEVQWYGGEPLLGRSTIERLSCTFINFCEARGIRYSASMLSNCSLIDAETARMLANCRVESVLATVDCTPELMDKRRVAKNGGSSYEMTMAGIRNLRQAGIAINAIANVDEIAMREFPLFRKRMREEEGIDFMPAMLKDYRRDCGGGRYADTDIQLCTAEGFSKAAHAVDSQLGLDQQTLAARLAPAERFCTRQLENYFVIDYRGDVYKCDGWVDHADHVMFNLLDGVDVSALNTATENPWDDPFCKECVIQPMCLGACKWDREVVDPDCTCNVLKYTVGDYVKDYRESFTECGVPFALLAPSITHRG